VLKKFIYPSFAYILLFILNKLQVFGGNIENKSAEISLFYKKTGQYFRASSKKMKFWLQASFRCFTIYLFLTIEI